MIDRHDGEGEAGDIAGIRNMNLNTSELCYSGLPGLWTTLLGPPRVREDYKGDQGRVPLKATEQATSSSPVLVGPSDSLNPNDESNPSINTNDYRVKGR